MHNDTGNRYKIVETESRMKNPDTGEWVDCVIYKPLYENAYKLFARETKAFKKNFTWEDPKKVRCCINCANGYDKNAAFTYCSIEPPNSNLHYSFYGCDQFKETIEQEDDENL